MIHEETILLALRRYHFLTLVQLLRLMGLGKTQGDKYVKNLLAAEYISVYKPPKNGWGSHKHVYMLEENGRAHLKRMGKLVPDRYRKNRPLPKQVPTQHTLDLNDVIISAELMGRKVPWLQLMMVVHERDFKRTRAMGTKLFEPDGWLEFYYYDNPDDLPWQYPVLLELDRDTQEQPDIQTKVRNYCALILNENAYQERFETKNLVAVAFVTPSILRRNLITRWITLELEALGRPDLAHYFNVTQCAPSQPEWFWLGPHWRQPFCDDDVSLFDLQGRVIDLMQIQHV